MQVYTQMSYFTVLKSEDNPDEYIVKFTVISQDFSGEYQNYTFLETL
jgi:hypothetical protein